MSTYADLRHLGKITLAATEAGQITSLRRQAKADGLQVVASRIGDRRQGRQQARTRPYSVALVHPSDPTTIYAPDKDVTP